jgi:hypothetical protein
MTVIIRKACWDAQKWFAENDGQWINRSNAWIWINHRQTIFSFEDHDSDLSPNSSGKFETISRATKKIEHEVLLRRLKAPAVMPAPWPSRGKALEI